MDDRVAPISRSNAGDSKNISDVENYLQQPPRDRKAFEEELARHGGGIAANGVQTPFNSAEIESGADRDRLSTSWFLTGTVQWKAPASQESAPASSKAPDTHPQTKNDDTLTLAKLRAEYLVVNRTRGDVDVSGLARDLTKVGDAGPAVTDAVMQRLSPENRDKLAAELDANGKRGALTGQPIAQGDAYGVLYTPNITGFGSQTEVTPPMRTVITAGQHYGPTFTMPEAATHYAQDGLEKRRFGDSDGAAIVKEGGGYSVYGARLGEQFSIRALPDKADENFKALKPQSNLIGLVTKEGVVADYQNQAGRVDVIHTKPGREPSLAEKAAHYLFGDSHRAPSSAQATQPERGWSSHQLDEIEHWVDKTMPTGSQFSWANTWQAQAGSKQAQGAAREALAALGFELGANAKGAWKFVAAPAAGAGAYVLGKAIPSDVEVRVDSEGRKSNILFLDTNVHAGTVRFGMMNNLADGALKGKTPGETAAVIGLDTALKTIDYQHTNTLPLLAHALRNGLSAEMNLEVSFAQEDGGAHGAKDPAKAPLAKVWLSFSFVVASEGSTYKPSASKPASASENASSKKETWKPIKDKVTVVVQAPVDAKKIDDDTLAKLTSGNELDKVEAAAKIAVDNASNIPIRSAFHGALIASGLRPGERIEDLLQPGMTASINTEYSTSRKVFGNMSGSLLAETKITTGMTANTANNGERLKFLGIKTTVQTTAEGKLGPVDLKLARRPGLQVNIPLSIDNTGRISAQGISRTLDDITSRMKTAQSAPAAHPAEFARPYTTQLEALRSGVIDELRETGHWSADERRQVEEKWRQAMDLAHALEQ